MTQSMNGISFYTSGINDTDNLTVNNISCNNIASNNISTTGVNCDNLFSNSVNTTDLTTVQVTTNGLTASGNVTFSTTPVSANIPTLPTHLVNKNYVDVINTDQDTRMTGIDTLNTTQNTRLTAIETLNTTQDTRLTGIDTLNTTQNTRLTAVETLNTTQDTRLTGIDTLNTTQNTRLTAVETLNTTQNTRLTAVETLNTTQDTRLTGIDTLNTTQNTRLTAVETLNTTQGTNITTLQQKTTGLTYAGTTSTITGILNCLSPPTSSTVVTSNTQLPNKLYVDGLTNALSTRVGTVETKTTGLTYAGTTTSVSGTMAFLNSPTVAISGTIASSVMPKSYIDGKTSQILYVTPVPATGPMTRITSSLDLLPYASTTILKAYTLSCNAVTCLGQIVAGGVGIVTSQIQVTNSGSVIRGLLVGLSTSVVGSNSVTFPTAFVGSIPKVLISSNNGTNLSSRNNSGFTYTCTVAGLSIDWIAIQT